MKLNFIAGLAAVVIFSSCAKEKEEKTVAKPVAGKEFEYVAEQFADIKVLRTKVREEIE